MERQRPKRSRPRSRFSSTRIGRLAPSPCAYSTPTSREPLSNVGLPALVERLDESDNWQMRLSGGEQQRLGIARAMLAKPDWLFLDEATASLDEKSEADLYRAIAKTLPNTTLVSIGHCSTLNAFPSAALFLKPTPTTAAGGMPAATVRPFVAPTTVVNLMDALRRSIAEDAKAIGTPKKATTPKPKKGKRSRGTAVADCGAKRATRDGNEARYAADEPTQIWIATISGCHDLIVRGSGRQEGLQERARFPRL